MGTNQLGRAVPIFLALLLVSACASGGRPIPGGDTVVAEAPVRKVGDEWRYTGGNYSRVVTAEGERYVMVSNLDPTCSECRYVYDRNGNITKVSDANGNPKPAFQPVEFPLRVGKTWKRDTKLAPVGGGTPQPYSNDFKVEGYEEITVKAGTFKAFRISWYQVNRGPRSWSGQADLWWSPDVRNFVKAVPFTSNWFQPWELESYVLK